MAPGIFTSKGIIMAILKNFPGSLSGRIGDKIYRNVNGKIIVTSAPEKYKSLNTPEAIERREKFLFISKTASAVTQNYIIKNFWAKSKIKCTTPFQKFINVNHSKVTKDYNLSSLSLLPDNISDFNIDINNIIISKKEILIQLNAISKEQNLSIEIAPKISLQGIIFFMDPNAEMKDKFQIFPICSEDINSVLDEVLNFKITFNGIIPVLFERIPIKQVLLFMVVKNFGGFPFHISNQISIEVTNA